MFQRKSKPASDESIDLTTGEGAEGSEPKHGFVQEAPPVDNSDLEMTFDPGEEFSRSDIIINEGEINSEAAMSPQSAADSHGLSMNMSEEEENARPNEFGFAPPEPGAADEKSPEDEIQFFNTAASYELPGEFAKPRPKSPFPVKSVGAFAGLVLVVAAAGIFYFKSSYPAQHIGAGLKEAGWQFESLSGNISSGFEINGLKFENENIQVSFDHLGFKYSPKGLKEAALQLREFKADAIHLRMKQWPKKNEGLQALAQLPFSLSAPQFTAANGDLILPDGQHFQLQSVIATAPQLAADSINAGQFYVSGPGFVVSLESPQISAQEVSFAPGSVAQFTPEFSPSIMKAPIDVAFSGKMTQLIPFTPTVFEVSAFGKKLEAKWQNGPGDLRVTNLTLLHYLKTELPLWSLNLHAEGFNFVEGKAKFEKLEGTVGLRNIKFVSENGKWLHHAGVKTYEIEPRLTAVFDRMLKAEDPGFTLSSSTKQKASDILAELDFAKTPEALNESERAMVTADQKHFADAPDAGTFVALAPLVVEKVVQRQPSSAPKKKTQTNGIPHKLPPFKKHK